MLEIKQYIIKNAPWIFDGVGALLVIGIFGWVVRRFFDRRSKHQNSTLDKKIIQDISAGNASTNIQTGDASNVFITTNHPTRDMVMHDTQPIKIDRNGAVRHKVTIPVGDYQEFVWGAYTVRISISKIVKGDFRYTDLGTVVDFSIGGGLVYGGEECKKTGVNQYLIPQKKFNYDEPCSVYAYHVHGDSFNFFRVFVDHINPQSQQVTFNLFFVNLLDNIKTS